MRCVGMWFQGRTRCSDEQMWLYICMRAVYRQLGTLDSCCCKWLHTICHTGWQLHWCRIWGLNTRHARKSVRAWLCMAVTNQLTIAIGRASTHTPVLAFACALEIVFIAAASSVCEHLTIPCYTVVPVSSHSVTAAPFYPREWAQRTLKKVRGCGFEFIRKAQS